MQHASVDEDLIPDNVFLPPPEQPARPHKIINMSDLAPGAEDASEGAADLGEGPGDEPSAKRRRKERGGRGGNQIDRFGVPVRKQAKINVNDLKDPGKSVLKANAQEWNQMLDELVLEHFHFNPQTHPDELLPGETYAQGLRRHAYWLLELDETEDLPPAVVWKAATKTTYMITRLYRELVRHRLVETPETSAFATPLQKTNSDKIRTCYNIVGAYRDMILNEHISRTIHAHKPVVVPASTVAFSFATRCLDNNKPHQNFILYICERLLKLGLRKKGDDLYEERWIDGHSTGSWRRLMSIKDFCHKITSKEMNFKNWQDMTASSNTIETTVKLIKEGDNSECPELLIDRRKFSFPNGVFYAGHEPKFVEFVKPNRDASGVAVEDPESESETVEASVKLSDESDRASAKYFPQVFKWKEYQSYEDWYDVPTPKFNSVLEFQELPEDVIRVVYAMIGRMMYEVGETTEDGECIADDWQTAFYLKGVAGCGKSTILRVVMWLYERNDVGSLSNNIEVKFGLSTMADKLIVTCPEVKSDFALPQSELQSIISGEGVCLAQKNRAPWVGQWTAPLMLAGNERGGWEDASGSISRRMVMLLMKKAVSKPDGTLYSHMKKEMPALIYKFTRAYTELRAKELAQLATGNGGIWNCLPKYFENARQEVVADSNALEGFILETMEVDAGLQIPYKEFVKRHHEWCKDTNRARPGVFNNDYTDTTFAKYGISVINRMSGEYPVGSGKQYKNEKWIKGVSTREDASSQNIGGPSADSHKA